MNSPKPLFEEKSGIDYFLMVAADGEDINGRRVCAERIATHRLDQRVWPIYSRTKNRKAVKEGSRLVIYLGGGCPGAQHVIATAEVGNVRQPRRSEIVDPESIFSTDPYLILHLGAVKMLPQPVPLKPLIARLTFLNVGPKWGAGLVGGCRRITGEDYLLLSTSVRMTGARSDRIRGT